MKKIIVMLMAIMCFFAATANAAPKITDVKWGVINNNVLMFVVDMTDLTAYNVSLNGNQLTLTISAPLKSGVKLGTKIKSSLTTQMVVTSSATQTTVVVPLNEAITVNDYRAFTLRKDKQNNRPARIVVEITSPKKNPPPASAKPKSVSKMKLAYFGFALNPSVSTWYDEYGQLACAFDLNNSTFTEKGKTYKASLERRDYSEKESNGTPFTRMRYFLMLNDNGKLTEREINAVRHAKGSIMFLILSNYPTALQSTKTIPYTDSIGGVHLGMPRRQVEQLYGAPDSVSKAYETITAKYNKDNWEIEYFGNRVYGITMHKGGTRRFDRTGLGCDSSLDSFARAYNINGPINIMNRDNEPYRGSSISKGEWMYPESLWFIGNGDIKLTYLGGLT